MPLGKLAQLGASYRVFIVGTNDLLDGITEPGMAMAIAMIVLWLISIAAASRYHKRVELSGRVQPAVVWDLLVVGNILTIALCQAPFFQPIDASRHYAATSGATMSTHSDVATLEVDTISFPWELPYAFPIPIIPPENPVNPAKTELGRYLFYDTRLSGNHSVSCASCHIQALAFSDGKVTPAGATTGTSPRNTPSLANAAYNSSYTWANPTLTSLEDLVLIPLFGKSPVELGISGNEVEVMARLRSDKTYRALFATAYPEDADPFSWRNIANALATFVRSLISGNSAYDRYVAGDASALSARAKRGLALFYSDKLKCRLCHTGFNFTLATTWQGDPFTNRPFFNIGLYNLDGEGAYPGMDTGVYQITDRPEDMGRFRPPTLRNIALTAPYMHDGSVATLEEVIRLYAAGGRHITTGRFAGDGRTSPRKSTLVTGFEISDQEIGDLIAFLESLTDEAFVTDPRYGNPFLD